MITKYLIKHIRKNKKVVSVATFDKIQTLFSVELCLIVVAAFASAFFMAHDEAPVTFLFGICMLCYCFVTLFSVYQFSRDDLWEFKTEAINKYLSYSKKLKKEDDYSINFKQPTSNHKGFAYSISKNGITLSEKPLDTIGLLKEDGNGHYTAIDKWLRFVKEQNELPYIAIEEIGLFYQTTSPYVEKSQPTQKPSVILVLSDEFIDKYIEFVEREGLTEE